MICSRVIPEFAVVLIRCLAWAIVPSYVPAPRLDKLAQTVWAGKPCIRQLATQWIARPGVRDHVQTYGGLLEQQIMHHDAGRVRAHVEFATMCLGNSLSHETVNRCDYLDESVCTVSV